MLLGPSLMNSHMHVAQIIKYAAVSSSINGKNIHYTFVFTEINPPFYAFRTSEMKIMYNKDLE